MGRVAVEFLVSNYRDVVRAEAGDLPAEKVRHFLLQGTVDSAATNLVLPSEVAERLGLQKAGEANVQYADRRAARRALADDARVELLGRRATFQAVLEPDRTTALIGAVVLETLDLLVDCTRHRLIPRDPTVVTAELE